MPSYPAAVVRAGGLPMVIPPLPAVGAGAVLERIDPEYRHTPGRVLTRVLDEHHRPEQGAAP